MTHLSSDTIKNPRKFSVVCALTKVNFLAGQGGKCCFTYNDFRTAYRITKELVGRLQLFVSLLIHDNEQLKRLEHLIMILSSIRSV